MTNYTTPPVGADSQGAAKAAEVVLRGGLVLFPTDTTYAVGGNALSPTAIAAVQQLKGRSASKAISVMIPSVSQIPDYAVVDDVCMRLAQAILPGPVTLILKTRERQERILCAGATVGIRVPASPFCHEFSALAGVPLTATSANASGAGETFTLAETLESLRFDLRGVELLVDGNVQPEHKASTIVDLSANVPRILREGAFDSRKLWRVWASVSTGAGRG